MDKGIPLAFMGCKWSQFGLAAGGRHLSSSVGPALFIGWAQATSAFFFVGFILARKEQGGGGAEARPPPVILARQSNSSQGSHAPQNIHDFIVIFLIDGTIIKQEEYYDIWNETLN